MLILVVDQVEGVTEDTFKSVEAVQPFIQMLNDAYNNSPAPKLQGKASGGEKRQMQMTDEAVIESLRTEVGELKTLLKEVKTMVSDHGRMLNNMIRNPSVQSKPKGTVSTFTDVKGSAKRQKKNP